MKKLTKSVLFALILALALIGTLAIGCGDDDDDDDSGTAWDDDDFDSDDDFGDDDDDVPDDDDDVPDDDDDVPDDDDDVPDDDDDVPDDDDDVPDDDDDVPDDDDDVPDDDDDDDDDDADFGKALSFDGVDGYAAATQSSTLSLNGSITVEAWARLTAFPTSFHAHVVDKLGSPLSGPGAQAGYLLRIETTGVVAFCAVSGATTYCAKTVVPVSTNTWHHLVGIHDPSNSEVRVYLDGQNMASIATAGFGTDTTGYNLQIARHNPADYVFDMVDVDEVRLSNLVRVPGATYVVPTSPYVDDANTMGLWHFEEATGTVAADSSTNGNDFTLFGATTWIDHL
jgi:hypothetical protein